MTAIFSGTRSPARILSMVSTPRVEPIRQGVHLPQEAVACCEGLVVKRGVEQNAREVCAKRAANLHRAHRAPRERAAADIIDEFAKRDAERGFEQSAISDIAGELDRHRAARAADAEIGIGFGAAGEDEGNGRE